MRKIITAITSVMLLTCTQSWGQEYMPVSDTARWLTTSNAAGLGILNLPSVGSTSISGSYKGGDFRRSQESKSIVSYGGRSESYRRLGDMRLYGDFSYTAERHHGRAWCDNTDPYIGNPYVVGSSIPGDYAKQAFDFTVKGAGKQLADRLWLGAGASYHVSEFSRLNDPRSRAQLADYSVLPGFAIQLGRHSTLGLNLDWRHRKEKMLKLVAKSETIDRFTYYDYKGLADYATTGILFFTRRYISDWYGGQIQFDHEGSWGGVLARAGYRIRQDSVTGEAEESPGSYSSQEIEAGIEATLRSGGNIHCFSLGGSFIPGQANEFLQERVTEVGEDGFVDTYWKLLMENVRYKNHTADADLGWKMFHGGVDYKWFVGAGVGMQAESREYILPHSEMSWLRIVPDVQAGVRFAGHFRVEGNISYILGIPGELILDQALEKNKKTVIRDNVVIPDFDHLGADALGAGLMASYHFKVKGNHFYIKAEASHIQRISPAASSESGLSGRTFGGLSIGFIAK